MICPHADLWYIDPQNRGLECALSRADCHRTIYCHPEHEPPAGCPLDLGPWGAWRAGIGEMVALYLSGFDRSRHWLQQTKVIRTWHPGISEPLGAVGWSP